MGIQNILPQYQEEYRKNMLDRPVNLTLQSWGENRIIISTNGCGCCVDDYTTESKEEEILAVKNHLLLLENQIEYWKRILEKLEEQNV